jgi:hypothetical protein
LAIGEKKRFPGHRGGRPDCRDFRPYQACILFGWDIPLSITGGLLGRRAFDGGITTRVLGELVMRLIVLPLSALRARGPYELHDLILGLLVHMVVVGLPISFSVARFREIDVWPFAAI